MKELTYTELAYEYMWINTHNYIRKKNVYTVNTFYGTMQVDCH